MIMQSLIFIYFTPYCLNQASIVVVCEAAKWSSVDARWFWPFSMHATARLWEAQDLPADHLSWKFTDTLFAPTPSLYLQTHGVGGLARQSTRRREITCPGRRKERESIVCEPLVDEAARRTHKINLNSVRAMCVCRRCGPLDSN